MGNAYFCQKIKKMELSIFYTQALKLKAPWQITKTEMDAKGLMILVHLGHEKGDLFPCPCCGKVCSVYDHQELRTWRHLDTCQYQTYLKAKLPRTNCLECGIKTVAPTWSTSHSRLTAQFECHVIDVLQQCQVIQSSALLLQLSADQITYLMKTVHSFKIKEEFKQFFSAQTVQDATLFFNKWFDKVSDSQNTQLIKVAKMFKNHFQGLINYTTHRISNAIAESLNSRIQQLKANARGFNSPRAFRIAILFHLGKLDLYP